jgi:hypothetical protein
LNSEKIWKIEKKSKFSSKKIWKLWKKVTWICKKIKLNSEMIWKIQKKIVKWYGKYGRGVNWNVK